MINQGSIYLLCLPNLKTFLMGITPTYKMFNPLQAMSFLKLSAVSITKKFKIYLSLLIRLYSLTNKILKLEGYLQVLLKRVECKKFHLLPRKDNQLGLINLIHININIPHQVAWEALILKRLQLLFQNTLLHHCIKVILTNNKDQVQFLKGLRLPLSKFLLEMYLPSKAQLPTVLSWRMANSKTWLYRTIHLRISLNKTIC
jgi:hypothetical protein